MKKLSKSNHRYSPIPTPNVNPYLHFPAQKQVTKVAPENHSEETDAKILGEALEDVLHKVNSTL